MDAVDGSRLAEAVLWGTLALCGLGVLLGLAGAVVRRCRRADGKEAGDAAERPLPSYTLVTGLPSYDEALDQLQRRRELRRSSSAQRAIEMAVAAARAAGNLMAVTRLQTTLRRLSVGDLIKYKFRSDSFDKILIPTHVSSQK